MPGESSIDPRPLLNDHADARQRNASKEADKED